MNALWLNVLVGILATLAVYVLVKFAAWGSRMVRTILKTRSRFRLTGIWIGMCKLPSYPKDVKAIEIYRLVVRKEHVTFEFFNYRPDVQTVTKYEGAGICRGKQLSAFYYVPAAHSFESGVFVVRQIGQELRGVYAQYDPGANEELMVSPENFVLTRTHLPTSAHVKMILGWQPFLTYKEAGGLYNAALAARALPSIATEPNRQLGQ